MFDTVFLVVLLLSSTGGPVKYTHYKMPDMYTCQRVIATSKIEIPTGGDAEAAIAMYCTYDK